MANYRVIDPHGTVVATKDISSSEDAHAWFKDSRADNEELGWRLEVEHDGDWAFFMTPKERKTNSVAPQEFRTAPQVAQPSAEPFDPHPGHDRCVMNELGRERSGS